MDLSLLAQMVKNLPAMQIQSLGWEDPLEKGIATHSNSLAWRIPWTEEPGGLQSMGSQRVRHDCATNTFTVFSASTQLSAFIFIHSFIEVLLIIYYMPDTLKSWRLKD